jgi:hypothetical protein
LGKILKAHLPGILPAYRLDAGNAAAKNINSQIQAAIVRARGFQPIRSLTNIIFLATGSCKTSRPIPSITRCFPMSLSTQNGREPHRERTSLPRCNHSQM